MMKKLILSACLVAGTSVGAGMLALPMVLCKIGIIPTIGLILSTWFFMYISGLLGLELNLRTGKGLPLSTLARAYSGPLASAIGSISFIFLIYALLCAYIYGGASILHTLFHTHFGWEISQLSFMICYAISLGLILPFTVEKVLQINRFLLTILIMFFFLLMGGLLQKIVPTHLPLFSTEGLNLTSWTHAIPILFTSFGFQVIFHTLTNFCDKDPKLLKRAIFWGSLIPACVYIIWTVGAISVLYHHAPQDYQRLREGHLDVGAFIQILSHTATWPMVQILASVISLVAIVKSSIGVGLGLFETWQTYFKENLKQTSQKILSVTLTILPPLVISWWVPELFLKALRLAGVSLTIIAIFLPLWLITRPRAHTGAIYYPITENRSVQWLCFLFGLTVVLCEASNFWIITK